MDPTYGKSGAYSSRSGHDKGQEIPFELGLMAGVRPYYTSNVLRINDNETGSGVLETSAGFSVTTQTPKAGKVFEFSSPLGFSDAMGQL